MSTFCGKFKFYPPIYIFLMNRICFLTMNGKNINILNFKVSRIGRKLQFTNDSKILGALPKDIPERTWAETLQKEDNDLIIFEIREEIFDETMKICYEKYMTRQTTAFTADCASIAWLKLIDLYFYRHDPGEDPTAYPPCFIPKRESSWEPDDLPDPSPKDTLCDQNLTVEEEYLEEVIPRWPSSDSLDYPVVKPIPEACRFPGRVQLFDASASQDEASWLEASTLDVVSRERVHADSELLQKVTDYSTELSPSSTKESDSTRPSKVDGSMQGAGDSFISARTSSRRLARPDRSKKLSKGSLSKLKMKSPAELGSRSVVSMISDCRLRSLRLDTQFEITDEKLSTPAKEAPKRN